MSAVWRKVADDEHHAEVRGYGWLVVKDGSEWTAAIDSGRGWTEVERFYRLTDAKRWVEMQEGA
jgi:hypothetical protein